MSSVNHHDSARFIDAMENISGHLGDDIKTDQISLCRQRLRRTYHQKIFEKKEHQELYPVQKLQNKHK
jgi:hypothetical protein